MDLIRINELEVRTRIGVPDVERAQQQRLLVTVELRLPLEAAAAADDPSKSVDYGIVRDCIHEQALRERKTIEAFAEDCAKAVLSRTGCKRVGITVRKFPFPDTQSVEVTILRP